MEEFENNGGERTGDEDFYEKIEAPKFVDLTSPDRHRPENDDRYWFCLRVGCDQNHEEEMDSEAIYKNFVLRVMAARSPNVRLGKALCRENSSTNLKCPRTVPAKASKSRMSKLAIISSVSQQMVDANKNARPLSNQTATPSRNSKQPSGVAEALTTPRNKKHPSNIGGFQSVRNPKPPKIEVPNKRVVAKALVFHSPKKTVKLKKSVELSNSLRKVCVGMKILEITNGQKHSCPVNKERPLDASRKKLRGREVQSRVYDSLRAHTNKGLETKPSKLMMTKNQNKEIEMNKVAVSSDRNKSNVVDIEEKPLGIAVESCSVSATAESREGNGNQGCLADAETFEQQSDEHKSNTSSETSEYDATSASNSGKRKSGRREDSKIHEDTRKPSSVNKKVHEAVEIPYASNFKLMDQNVMEIDNKENASVCNENRKLNTNTSRSTKKNILLKHENSKSTQKVTEIMNKEFKERSVTAAKRTQGTTYRKPKPTNPKPFRLRTDERGILKEANLEKKQLATPVKEQTVIRGSQNGNSRPQQENIDKTNVEFLGQIGTAPFAHEETEKVPVKRTTKAHQMHKTTEKSEDRLKGTTKSTFMRKVVRSQGVASTRKKTVDLLKHGRLEVINETSPAILRPKRTSKPIESGGASLATKASGSSPSPHTKRPAGTIPKEPNFHSIHTPKSCARRVATSVL